MDENARKINAIYARQIWDRYVLQILTHCGISCCLFGGAVVRRDYWVYFILRRMGAGDLLLFSDVFQKCEQTVWGESEISRQDSQDSRLLPRTDEYLEAEAGVPYLYVPELQAENPYPQRQGQDRGALSQVWHYVYKKQLIELSGFRSCAGGRKEEK